jgi:hypothetical protein
MQHQTNLHPFLPTPLGSFVIWQSSSPCFVSHGNKSAVDSIQVPGQTKTQVSKWKDPNNILINVKSQIKIVLMQMNTEIND